MGRKVRNPGEALHGCDTCGAQMRRDDHACPICGAPQRRRAVPAIPVRRHGVVPPYPDAYAALLADDSPRPPRPRLRMWRFVLAAASAGLLAACACYLIK